MFILHEVRLDFMKLYTAYVQEALRSFIEEDKRDLRTFYIEETLKPIASSLSSAAKKLPAQKPQMPRKRKFVEYNTSDPDDVVSAIC